MSLAVRKPVVLIARGVVTRPADPRERRLSVLVGQSRRAGGGLWHRCGRVRGNAGSPHSSEGARLAIGAQGRQRVRAKQLGPVRDSWLAALNRNRRLGQLEAAVGTATGARVGVDHHLDKLLERDTRLPAELLARFRRVADEMVDLGRPEEL